MNKIKKNQQGYGYKYADLAQIHDYCEANDIRYYQYIEPFEGNDYIMTVIRYLAEDEDRQPRRGCRVVQATLSGKSNPAQEQGSAITYARRYSLLMALGLATSDDDAESLSTYKGKSKASYKKDKASATFSPSPEDVEDMKRRAGIIGWTGDREKGMLSYFGITKYEDMTEEQMTEFYAMSDKELGRMDNA